MYRFYRKKDKDGKKKKLVEVSKIIEEEKPQTIEVKRTKAELAFQKMQEKMVSICSLFKHIYIMTSNKKSLTLIKFIFCNKLQQTERIKQKASKTHKQRVEEFNRHLDSLTEHFDIPKVSWTK